MRTDMFQQSLEDLNGSTADIEASALISIDGLMIASALPNGMDEDRIGAMSAALLSLGDRTARELARGSLQRVLVQGERGIRDHELSRSRGGGIDGAGQTERQARPHLPGHQAGGGNAVKADLTEAAMDFPTWPGPQNLQRVEADLHRRHLAHGLHDGCGKSLPGGAPDRIPHRPQRHHHARQRRV